MASNKKVKAIQSLVDEYISKQRNVSNFDLVPQFTKRIQDTIGSAQQAKHVLPAIMMAEALTEKGKIDELEKFLRQSLEQFKDDCILLYYLAIVDFKKKQYESAIQNATRSKQTFDAQTTTIVDANAHLATTA